MSTLSLLELNSVRIVSQTCTVMVDEQDGTHLLMNSFHDSTAHAGNQHHTLLVDCALFLEDSSTVQLYTLGDQLITGKDKLL